MMADTKTPGVSVGVLHGNRAFGQGFGVTNIDAPSPVDNQTIFQIGSTGKTFTATAIMRLVDRGELELDVPVRRYLRNFQMRDKEATSKVTLRHLLTHTAGWAGDYFEDHGRGDDALGNYVASMRTIPHLTPLGEVWHYNNAAFCLAGHILATVAGTAYEDAVKELVLDPLGMTNSVYYLEDVLMHRAAVGHLANGRKQTRIPRWWGSRALAPAGGLVSDIVDQLRWASFNLGDGSAPDGKQLLKKRTFQSMQKPQAEAGSLADSVGISWLIEEVDGVKLVSHGGTTVGQLSAFTIVPEARLGVISMSNSTSGRTINRAVVNWALENYAGVVRTPPSPGSVSEDELKRYEGNYVDAFKQAQLQLKASGKRIVTTIKPLGANGEGPLPKPFQLALVTDDRAVQTTGMLKGLRVEFLRDGRNRVRWVRYGGRLYRRTQSAS
jgi:CubicO group peptidase (beta-lactamase class C family)